MKSVLLYDEEDDQCLRMEATSTRYRGIEVYARNEFDEKVVLCVDAGLFKKFCQQAIKHIDASRWYGRDRIRKREEWHHYPYDSIKCTGVG